MDVHSSFLHKSPNLETTQMWLDKNGGTSVQWASTWQ